MMYHIFKESKACIVVAQHVQAWVIRCIDGDRLTRLRRRPGQAGRDSLVSRAIGSRSFAALKTMRLARTGQDAVDAGLEFLVPAIRSR